MRTMYTEMSLHPDEFDFFQVGVDLDLTFCLKELRVTVIFGGSRHSNIMCVYLCVCVRVCRGYVCDWLTQGSISCLRGHISGPVTWILECPKACVLGSLYSFRVNFPLGADTRLCSQGSIT